MIMMDFDRYVASFLLSAFGGDRASTLTHTSALRLLIKNQDNVHTKSIGLFMTVFFLAGSVLCEAETDLFSS